MNVIYCISNIKSIDKIKKYTRTDVEILGYIVNYNLTGIEKEVKEWKNTVTISWNVLCDKKNDVNRRIATVNKLIKVLDEMLPKKIEISNNIIVSISQSVENIIEYMNSNNNLDTCIADELAKISKLCIPILEELDTLDEVLMSDEKIFSLQEAKELIVSRPTVEKVMREPDYIVIYEEGDWPDWLQGMENVLHFQKFLEFYWKISDEHYYFMREFQKANMQMNVEGIVLGMSYTRRGINVKRLLHKTCCLAAPSQDLYLDYHMCKFACEETTTIKYCILGISPFSLWYDMSLSSHSYFRNIYYYPKLKTFHNLSGKVELEKTYNHYKSIYDKVFLVEFIDVLYQELYQGYSPFDVKDLSVYNEEVSRNDQNTIIEIEKLFNKPYDMTYVENVTILEELMAYLQEKEILPILIIPPFPKLYREIMPKEMLEKTIMVIQDLQKKYKICFLNLIEDERFEDVYFSDASHLNYFGANLMSDILNAIIREWL